MNSNFASEEKSKTILDGGCLGRLIFAYMYEYEEMPLHASCQWIGFGLVVFSAFASIHTQTTYTWNPRHGQLVSTGQLGALRRPPVTGDSITFADDGVGTVNLNIESVKNAWMYDLKDGHPSAGTSRTTAHLRRF